MSNPNIPTVTHDMPPHGPHGHRPGDMYPFAPETARDLDLARLDGHDIPWLLTVERPVPPEPTFYQHGALVFPVAAEHTIDTHHPHAN